MAKMVQIKGGGRGMVPGLILTAAVVAFTAAGSNTGTRKAGLERAADVTVSYGELDLESEAGAKVLLRRIEWAASKVCGGAPRPVELWKHGPYQKCVDETMNRAVYDVNAPLLTTLYKREKTGKRTEPQPVSQD